MGSENTHWRTGTCGMTWSTKCAAVCDMRRAPHDGQKPRRLQLKARSLSWPHSPRQQPQEAVRQDAALEEGVEPVLDESRQFRSGAGLGVGDETGRMLPHQAVQRGLPGPVSLVTERVVGGFAKSRLRESGHGAASKYCAYRQSLGAAVSGGEVDR
jgi:hypothetical protein